MERLTFEGNFCEIAQCKEVKCPYDTNCSQKQVWERLKQYEDTGLSPIACEESAKIEKGLSEGGYSISRMVELMCADKEGRVVVLPCKVGDTVYTNNRVLGADNAMHDEICTRRIKGYGGNALNKVWLIVSGDYCDLSIFPSEFGKTVFFTREEAEKALRGMEGKKDG